MVKFVLYLIVLLLVLISPLWDGTPRYYIDVAKVLLLILCYLFATIVCTINLRFRYFLVLYSIVLLVTICLPRI
jgi:hypothetical protein